MLPTYKQQQLLIYGYVRCESIYDIPISLIQLILLFYNEIFYWKLTDKQLKDLFSMKSGEHMKSKSFKIQNFVMQYIVYPNYGLNGCMRFAVHVNSFSTSKYVIMNVRFCCFEANIYDNRTKKLTSSNNELRSYHGVMLLSDYKDFKEINLCYLLDIIHTETVKTDVIMSKKITVKWNINNNLLARIKTCNNNNKIKYGYCSNFFDNNWCIYFLRDKNGLGLFLRLKQLPYNVEKVKLEFTMHIKYDNKIITKGPYIETYCYNHTSFGKAKIQCFDIKTILMTKKICFVVDINIFEVWLNNELIKLIETGIQWGSTYHYGGIKFNTGYSEYMKDILNYFNMNHVKLKI